MSQTEFQKKMEAILPKMTSQDKAVFLAFGEGMAAMADRCRKVGTEQKGA